MGWEMENNDAMAQASGVSSFCNSDRILHATPCRQKACESPPLVPKSPKDGCNATRRKGTVGPHKKKYGQPIRKKSSRLRSSQVFCDTKMFCLPRRPVLVV